MWYVPDPLVPRVPRDIAVTDRGRSLALPYNNSSRHIMCSFCQIFQLNFTTIFVRLYYVIGLLFRPWFSVVKVQSSNPSIVLCSSLNPTRNPVACRVEGCRLHVTIYFRKFNRKDSSKSQLNKLIFYLKIRL